MTLADIAHERLHNQHLAAPVFERPADEVSWQGAMQSQDYYAAQWALGQRLAGATDAAVDAAFATGEILRTHVLRPTWHFVVPADIRWMLALTAPRIKAASLPYHRRLELDERLLRRTNALLAKALRDGAQLTRDELRTVLERAGISAADTVRMSFIMMHAELDAVICSGARRGKQFTYALLEERAPQAAVLKRDEALAELVLRFFRSHGPATANDFAKWSGLTVADGERGLRDVERHLERETAHGRTWWRGDSRPAVKRGSRTAYLLPNYDEYVVGYRHHDVVASPHLGTRTIFSNIIVLDGRVAGTWKRTLKRDGVLLEPGYFEPPGRTVAASVRAAARRYGQFLELPVELRSAEE
ncbi:MAG TPA: winged helix DNA-binding domain-containing protein [Candidatus Kapabacteria bacterium]|nr:winged helix DNA-binding domain-containing protein [Candidatus Kapabacteria bacterium]